MTDTAPSAPAPMTGLERELLGCVERLTTASEASAAQFAALERRSTGQISERLTALEDCFSSLLKSQITLTGAFASLAAGSSSPASLRRALEEADKALKETSRLPSVGLR
jgi:hypothetical protein